MSNEEILNKRWEKTDKTLKDYLKKFNKLGVETIDKLIEMFDTLNITFSDMNKPISKKEKRKLDRKIDEWSKEGILTDYLAYLVSSKRKYTYSDLIEILIYGIYAERNKEVSSMSKEIFTLVSQDIYEQAYSEIPIKPKEKKKITSKFVDDLLYMAIYGKTWYEFLKAVALTEQQEAYKQIMTMYQQEITPTETNLKPLIEKQNNRLLLVRDNKYSGSISDMSRQVGNKTYVEAFEGDKTLQVRFIAEMDNRTTKMCVSMDNMLFYVHDWNKFYRYSDIDGGYVLYTVKGLKSGINLPPITNHFHYCRSTVTYLIDTSRKELNKNLQTTKEQEAISKWESSDFYNINRKMYSRIALTKEEKQLVKNLYTALNKQPYYEMKENEIATRVLEVDNKTLKKIIKEHSINEKYISKSFEAYSLKSDYNKNANVFFYVKNGKKAKRN